MKYAIWLSSLKGVGLSEKKRLLREHESFEAVFEALKDEGFAKEKDLEEAEKLEEICSHKGIWIRSFKEFEIQNYDDLPLLLYCRGQWKNFGESIGIVGTRRCTEYGKKVASGTAKKMAEEGVTVISGMARGIDGIAHSAAIKAGGYTVAVLGTGPDICFPSEHRSLMEAIIDTGLVISEYPPGFHGNISTFPQRNRIIAAFSDRLLVVESGEKGGALITAEKAREYGKEVYALPGRIDSPESRGTNRLIREGKAVLWLPEDCKSSLIQYTLPLQQLSPKKDDDIIAELKKASGRISVAELAKGLDRSTSEIFGELTELELEDRIKMEGDIIWLLQ